MGHEGVDTGLSNKGVVEACFSIDDNYSVILGDERFYRMMGDNTLYTFNRLVSPEDITLFEEYMCNDACLKPIMVRCMVKDQSYRWVVLHKQDIKGGKNKKIFEMKIQDVINVCENFNHYYFNVQKYRTVLNMLNDKIFEYDFNTNFLRIYCYINNKAEIFEKSDLDEWRDNLLRKGYVSMSQLNAFNSFYDNIKMGSESFSVTFKSGIMSKGERQDVLNFKGQTIVDGTKKKKVVGLISELGGERMKEKTVLLDVAEVNKDSATGVLNKKAITDEITATINLANVQPHHGSMFLLVLDIDDFKSVNDTYGHYFGDEVIKHFADELNSAVGTRGIVGRIGGDEFMILIKELEDIDTLRIMLKAIRKKLKVELSMIQKDYEFSTSIGIAQYDKDATDFKTLFEIADGALYIAKEKGKDRFIIYDKEIHGDVIRAFTNDRGNKKEFSKPIDKYDFASDLMIRIVREGQSAVKDALVEIIDKMNIHGVRMYQGRTLECIYSNGHFKKNAVDIQSYFTDAYVGLFDKHNINKVNNIAALAVDYPEAYQYFKDNNICSYLQFVSLEHEDNRFMIEFDTFGENRRKWSEDDIETIYLVVKAIINVYS